MTITIRVEDNGVLDRLQELIDRMEDPRPMMMDIAETLRDHAEEAFAREGPGWKQLSEATIKQRGNAHPILQRTGQLAASLAVTYGRNFAAVGSAKEYAAIHQLGGMAGRGLKVRIPARPYLPVEPDGSLTPGARRDVLAIVDRFLASLS
jgi:phage virion morphogenesis protein